MSTPLTGRALLSAPYYGEISDGMISTVTKPKTEEDRQAILDAIVGFLITTVTASKGLPFQEYNPALFIELSDQITDLIVQRLHAESQRKASQN